MVIIDSYYADMDRFNLKELSGVEEMLYANFAPFSNGGLREGLLLDEERLRSRLKLQVETSLAEKFATLDSGIIHGRRDVGSVKSKIYNIDSVYAQLRRIGFDLPEIRISSSDASLENLDSILMQIKFIHAKLLNELPEWDIPLERKRRKANIPIEFGQRHAYVKELVEMIGKKIVSAVVLYGSAATETDEARYDDYDHFIVVREGFFDGGDFQRVYGLLCGRKLEHPFDQKELSLHLVEETSFPRLIRYSSDPIKHYNKTVVLYGDIEFYDVPESEACERRTSHAVQKARSVRAACRWVPAERENILKKPALHRYFEKIPWYILELGIANNFNGNNISTNFIDSIKPGRNYSNPDKLAYVQRLIVSAANESSSNLQFFFDSENFTGSFFRNGG